MLPQQIIITQQKVFNKDYIPKSTIMSWHKESSLQTSVKALIPSRVAKAESAASNLLAE